MLNILLSDAWAPMCNITFDRNLHPKRYFTNLAIRFPQPGFTSFQPFTPQRLSSQTPPDFPRSAALGKRHWCSFETSTVLVCWATQKSWARFFDAHGWFFWKSQGLGRWLCFFWWNNVLGFKMFNQNKKMVTDSKWFFSQKSTLFQASPFW